MIRELGDGDDGAVVAYDDASATYRGCRPLMNECWLVILCEHPVVMVEEDLLEDHS